MTDSATITQMIQDVGANTTLRLMGIFQADGEKRLAAVRAYLDEGGALTDLRLHAHSLKGLCITYGAPEGGELAQDLQDACDRGDEAEVRALAERVLETIPVEIEAVLATARELAAKA